MLLLFLLLLLLIWLPLLILAATCFITIYYSAQVLKPSDFDKMRESYSGTGEPSPFFFGNFYKNSASEYFSMIKDSLKDEDDIKSHLAQDLYYIGKRLGDKMSMVRTAYNILISGIWDLWYSVFVDLCMLNFCVCGMLVSGVLDLWYFGFWCSACLYYVCVLYVLVLQFASLDCVHWNFYIYVCLAYGVL